MSVSYEKRQEKFVKKHNIKIGDYVTVLQKYDNETCGTWSYRYIWVSGMNRFVGKSCEVVDVRSDAIELRLAEGSNSYYFPYSILRKEKEMKKSYKERQAEWVKKNGIKKGDEVRLVRLAVGEEGGWPNVWPTRADGWVGKILKVRGISGENIACYNPEVRDWYGFPYFVLEKISHKEKEMKESYKVRQAKWLKENHIQIGDRVRILRKAKDREDGWPNNWSNYINDYVGAVGKIVDIDGSFGLGVNPEEESRAWYLPYFVLEKVTEPKDKEWEVSYGFKVKTGQPVLVRDNVDTIWKYGLFSHKSLDVDSDFTYSTGYFRFRFCIPYKGNEHLVGTKDDYEGHKRKSKSKFIFGAKVSATVKNRGRVNGILVRQYGDVAGNVYVIAVHDKGRAHEYSLVYAGEITYIN